MKCQRKYDLTYNRSIVRKPGLDTRARILGSHVHAGIAAALLYSFEHDVLGFTADDLIRAAVSGVRDYHRETYKQDQRVYDWETRQMVPDVEYRLMMEDVLIQALAVVRYQIPRISLGERYRVAAVGEVIGSDFQYVPFIEWQFSEPFEYDAGRRGLRPGTDDDFSVIIPNDYSITGTIDTVLQDRVTGEYLMVDWKTRGIMPDARLVDLDGQLKLYAAVVNRLAGRSVITRTCQYQVRNSVPKPAAITEKTRKISMAAISSTWEVWADSVRALGEDPEKYREQMQPKLHGEEHYTWPVFSPVTPMSSAIILDNVLRIGEAIRYADQRGSWPAIPSLMGCRFCEFKSLCRVKEIGGDEQFILDTEYEIAEPEDELEGEEV